jgi:hypothetical protein
MHLCRVSLGIFIVTAVHTVKYKFTVTLFSTGYEPGLALSTLPELL